MNPSYLLCGVAAFLVSADEPKYSAKNELEKLQGKWTVISLRHPIHFNAEVKGHVIKISEGKLTVGEEKGQISVAPSKNPPQFELVAKGDRPDEFFVILGVYKLDGDDLTVWGHEGTSMSPDGKISKELEAKRPKSFDDKDCPMIVLKRGEVKVKFEDEKFRKLIVGKWENISEFSMFGVSSNVVEFTVDGKFRRRSEKDEWIEIGTYVIEKEWWTCTLRSKKASMSAPIIALTETELISRPGKLKRIK